MQWRGTFQFQDQGSKSLYDCSIVRIILWLPDCPKSFTIAQLLEEFYDCIISLKKLRYQIGFTNLIQNSKTKASNINYFVKNIVNVVGKKSYFFFTCVTFNSIPYMWNFTSSTKEISRLFIYNLGLPIFTVRDNQNSKYIINIVSIK